MTDENEDAKIDRWLNSPRGKMTRDEALRVVKAFGDNPFRENADLYREASASLEDEALTFPFILEIGGRTYCATVRFPAGMPLTGEAVKEKFLQVQMLIQENINESR